MNLTRNDSRVLAMVILYQVDLYTRKGIDFELENIIENNINSIDGDISFIKELVNGVLEHEKELINLANQHLNNWNIARLGITDAQILKIAIYELLYTDTPKKVCIDEAIELAKSFSDEKVAGMINGTLDKIYHSLEKGKKDE